MTTASRSMHASAFRSSTFRASGYRTDTFRTDGRFSQIQDEAYNYPLSEDIFYVIALSYQMMKKSLMGFAIYGVPFWVVTVGFISML